MKEESGGEVPTGTVTGNADAVLGDATLVDEVGVARERFYELRRVLEFGSEFCGRVLESARSKGCKGNEERTVVEGKDGELDVALEVHLFCESKEEDLNGAGGVLSQKKSEWLRQREVGELLTRTKAPPCR